MITNTINTSNTLKWTKSAIECLNNHCICKDCYLKEIVHNCKMKRTVLELYKKFGKPEEYKEPLIEV